MHHPDSAGDSGSVRKMAHSAIFPRRGSNTGSGSGPTLSTPANSVVNNSHVPVDDYQSSLLIQSQPPAGSSSPSLQHPPPHSLNLHSQPQPTQSAGAQMKKKSGFQITSVTPAQISVSTNNSIAEDTESYDDLDESHTEDLSSSEILDVSLSRANDIAGAERSSSEETLNNFHEAETPGAISPNQPSHPHSLNQAPQHGGTLVNGTVHQHHHQGHHHPHQAQVHPSSPGPGGAPSALTSRALPSVAQKMPSNVGVTLENVSAGPPNVAAQPVGAVAQGSVPGMHSSTTGATVSIVNPLTSNVSNVNMLSSANVPVRGGISTSASSGGFPPSVMSCSGGSGGGGGVAMGGNLVSTPTINMVQQHQTMNSSITMTTAVTSACRVMGLSSGTQGGAGAALTQPGCAPVPAMASAHAPVLSNQPQPTPAPPATSSRFRVVKLDSSSEPFKKGRWTCTEYYDKETPASSSSSEVPVSIGRAGDSMRQFAPDNFIGGLERESTSGSSISSTVSTLSHYTESVGSGEAGGPLAPHLPQDYASPPHGFQAPLPGGLSMGVSHTQPHMHPQDLTHAHLKTTVAPSVPASVHQPVPMTGHQTTIGHPIPVMSQQQLTYAQAVATPPPGCTQGLVGVQQQQLGYASLAQQPSPAPQAAPVQVRPPEYAQPHPSLPQPAVSQPLPHLAGSGNGAGQMMGVPQQQQAVGSMPPQQPQVHLQTQPQQTSSLQTTTSTMVPQMGVAGLGQQPPSHPVPLDHQQQQPQSLPAQAPGLCAQLPSTVHPSQLASSSVLRPTPQNDPQGQPQAQNGGNVGGSGMASQSVPQTQPTQVNLDFTNAQAQAHAAQASVLYASLPSFTTTQLEDAQRLLLQHQSALLGLPKLAVGSGASTGQGHGAEGSIAAVSALTTSAVLFKASDGDEDSSSGASVVAIDNKIEQAMDLVKSHLMYAVREEVEVLKEQIKELIERNSQLEQENSLLKTLASPEQMAQFQAQVQTGSPPAPGAATGPQTASAPAQPASHNSGPLA